MPHLSQMRGFKPCISYYGSRYRNLPSLTIDDKSVDEVHLLRIYTFTVREKWVAEGEYTLKRHLDVYVTRNAKLVLIDHDNLKNSDDVQWYEVPFHSKTFTRESSSLHEYISSFCDYFMSGLPNGAKHSRPSSLESHYNSWDRELYYHDIHAESLPLILATRFYHVLHSSVNLKQEDLDREKADLQKLEAVTSCFEYVDDPENIVR